MADWEDVRRAVAGLPGVTEHETRNRTWSVGSTFFLWDRPMGKKDAAHLGDAMRDAPILGARVPDEGVKLALIADDPAVFFTIPHFDGYPAILVWLDRIDPATLTEVAVEAWLCRAPQRLRRAYLADREGRGV